MELPSLETLPPLRGRRVLVRVDFNVPVRDGSVVDDTRIRTSLPTLEWLLGQGAEVVACSHRGRPKGKPDPAYSMDPVRAELQRRLPAVELMENLRFDPGEEACDEEFVRKLVEGFDVYVNEAFGASHRAHASIVGPPRHLPSAAGRWLQREVEVLCGLRENPSRPFVAVLGGAKVSDKIGVIRALLSVVDRIVVGGGMCFTFLAAAGRRVGASLVEESMIDECRRLLEEGAPLVLPTDVVGLSPDGEIGAPEAGGEVRVFEGDLPDGWRGLDIGPASVEAFSEVIAAASTVFWNGPMGVFEDERFAAGTRGVGEAIAASEAFSVVGGGDSAAALSSLGLADSVDHVSTGGGASLELLEKGDLPGLEALRRSRSERGR
ncbi:MAG: phosphoglycerate kinase [Acidimicrobiales bacterium]|nr:MAG: phosphoglycerate kinase [Acidimicrobiales bacterium]